MECQVFLITEICRKIPIMPAMITTDGYFILATGGTGYAGRLAIIEILPMSERIRELVLKRCDVGEIARVAADEGMVTMRDDGLKKAVAGLTTIEEVLRVTPAAREEGS